MSAHVYRTIVTCTITLKVMDDQGQFGTAATSVVVMMVAL
jgi:hypothetical protein